MKKAAIFAVLFILMSLSAQAQFPEIKASSDSLNDRILITWNTDIDATTSLEINGKMLVFGPEKKFVHEELGLKAGKEYTYKIIACSSMDCSTYKSSIRTGGDAQNSATGNAIAELGNSSPVVYYFLISLLGLTLLFVSYRANQPDVKISSLLYHSEKHIRNGNHEHATPMYKEALGIYKNLSKDEKAHNYPRLMRVYNHLSLHQKQKEAKALTEKYQNGNITEQEMQRLRELLTE